jgi:hypothetical protein
VCAPCAPACAAPQAAANCAPAPVPAVQ